MKYAYIDTAKLSLLSGFIMRNILFTVDNVPKIVTVGLH